jgi:hypothetical protein
VLPEKIEQGTGQITVINLCPDHASNPLPLLAFWEYFAKKANPAVDGLAAYLKKFHQACFACALRPTLPEGHDHQDDTAPIHPSAHKQNRGWKAAASALWVAAAETLPDKILIGESVEKTTRLTLIVPVVQGSIAVRTTGGLPLVCQVLVYAE